jgi:putative ABC transport system permease protein
MFRTTLKSIFARKARILLTAIAVIAGTSFLSGTFIFTDTIQRTFDNLFTEVFKDVDSFVRSSNVIEGDFGVEQRQRVPVDLADKIAKVEGVKDAQPFVQGSAVVIKKDGEPLRPQGPPTFGGTINQGKLSAWKVIEGKVPNGSTEVALDVETAKKAGYKLNETVKISAEAGRRDFKLVGIVKYGGVSSPGGATFALFDTATASDFVAKKGLVDAVLVAGDGSVSDTVLTKRIESALGDQFETLTGAEITKKTQSDIGQAVGFITIFLTIFSAIALGVGLFVIYNVFSVTAAQRQRENALLRAIGASRRQVTLGLLIEAIAVGLVGAVIGLVAGIGLSKGLSALLSAFGADIPTKGLVFAPRTVLVTIATGLVATLLAAILPALRAGRVPPVAAMRDTALDTAGSTRGRLITAATIGGVGVLGVIAVIAGGDTKLLGLAVVAIFVGVIVIGPLMARPMARFLGKPIARFRGVTGSVARENVGRNPKRTARTAAPVLIGVALVTGATVFAASIKDQIRDVVGKQFKGDYVVTAGDSGGPSALGLSPELASQVNELPQVGVATGVGGGLLVFGDNTKGTAVVSVEPKTVGNLIDLKFSAGSLTDLTPTSAAVSASKAKREGLKLGSKLPYVDRDGKTGSLTVAGIYEKAELVNNVSVVVDQGLFAGTSGTSTVAQILLTKASGVSDSDFRKAVEPLVKGSGIGKLQSRAQFIDEATKQVSTFFCSGSR